MDIEKRWDVENYKGNWHVLPIDDDIEHELREECVCGPEARVNGNAWLYSHHSLDGREVYSGDL